jgi:hypothetical protein
MIYLLEMMLQGQQVTQPQNHLQQIQQRLHLKTVQKHLRQQKNKKIMLYG